MFCARASVSARFSLPHGSFDVCRVVIANVAVERARGGLERHVGRMFSQHT